MPDITEDQTAEIVQCQVCAFNAWDTAYVAKGKKGGKGRGGKKGKGKGNFVRKSNLSLEERRAALTRLKRDTKCMTCGEKGHWSGDKDCKMKGEGKGSGSTAMTATSSPEEIVQWYEGLARGEHDGCEWQSESESNSSHAFMAVKREVKNEPKTEVKAERFDISDDGSSSWIDAGAVHRNAGRSTALDSSSAPSSSNTVPLPMRGAFLKHVKQEVDRGDRTVTGGLKKLSAGPYKGQTYQDVAFSKDEEREEWMRQVMTAPKPAKYQLEMIDWVSKLQDQPANKAICVSCD